MKTLVIIPAFNESASILKTVADIKENAPGIDYVVINDCSTDNMKQICIDNNLNTINLPVNLGIGGAVQTGYKYAFEKGYDAAIQFDGDGQHEAKYIKLMEEVLEKEELDMVIGSRFIEHEGFQSTIMRQVGIKFFTGLIKVITGKKVTDPTSGMRMAGRNMIEMFTKRYPKDYPEPETVASALIQKMKVKEIPVEMREREEGVSSISPKKSIYYMLKVTLAILLVALRGR